MEERERDDGGGSLSLSGGREGGGKKHLVWPLSFFFVFHLLEKKTLNFSFFFLSLRNGKISKEFFEEFKFAEECL